MLSRDHTVNVLKFQALIVCLKGLDTLNSADPDQTALLKKQSYQGLPCLLF